MSKSTKSTVAPSTVRAWAREKGTYTGDFLNENARGRLPKAVSEAYTAETGNVVGKAAATKPVSKVTLRVTRVSAKTGKARKEKVEKSQAEVRTVPGVPSKGVLSPKSIALAEAHFSDKVADAPVEK